MSFKFSTIVIGLIASTIIQDQKFGSSAFSIPTEKYNLFRERCFNRSSFGEELILGQNEPIGVSIENLISMIEKFEKLNPQYKPAEVIRIFLERFHLYGFESSGWGNNPSRLATYKSAMTNAILSPIKENLGTYIEFPEHQFTEDEKCNLLFTISHNVNTTATKNEDPNNIIPDPVYARLTAPNSSNTDNNKMRDLGKEIPIKQTKKENIQVEEKKKNSRIKREIHMRTKRPREQGVASFLESKDNSISVNRILFGMLVGFANSQNQFETINVEKVTEILKEKTPERVKGETMNILLSVTLADLLGTNYPSMYVSDTPIFGAEGQWNDTVCHLNYILNSLNGIWGTLAEFKGGLDGYNIGRGLPELINRFPNITVSQVLRFYYSKNGLTPATGICQRHIHLDQIKDDLFKEARRYLAIWNKYHNNDQFEEFSCDKYIDSLKEPVLDVLKKAAVQNNDEKLYCYGKIESDVKNLPCESNSYAFFLLDINQKCNKNSNQNCQQADFVNELTRNLNMQKRLGSVSVFYNAEPANNQALVDDYGKKISTPLHSVVYNSTSYECASCKVLYGDTSTSGSITDRLNLFKKINQVIEEFDKVYENDSAVPNKLFFWFDFGSVQKIPSDTLEGLSYSSELYKLLYKQRDVNFFGISTNTTNMDDLILDRDRLVEITYDTNRNKQLIKEMRKRICRIPSVFQYTKCLIPSDGIVSEEFITPHMKQYWAIYPESFFKSFRIEFKFRAEESLIKVCFDRKPFPENDESNCKTNNDIKQDLELVVNNPCKDKTYENCEAMYFAISLHEPPININPCKDAKCRNIKQHRWFFTHTGMACNHANSIQVSALSITITTLSYFFIQYFRF